MKNKGILIFSCLIFLSIYAICCAQVKTTVSDILANSDKYDGKMVQVDGKAFSVKFKTSKKGNPYTTFKLTDGKNYLTVFSFGTLSVSEGDNVKVTGTYNKIKYVGRYVFYDEIDATNGKVEKR